MKLACSMLMCLLIAALVNAASMVVHDAARSVPTSLIEGIERLWAKKNIARTAGEVNIVGTELQTGSNRLRVSVSNKRDGLSSKACVTRELCRKKRIICSKKCKKSRGDIDKKHFPSCFIKCRKCSPNC